MSAGGARADRDERSPVWTVLVLGFVAMILFGVVQGELGLGRAIGFWPSVGIALPVACLALAVRRHADDYGDVFFNTVLTVGWGLMICLGVLHAEFELGRPLGFWPSAGLTLPVALVIATVREPDEKKWGSGLGWMAGAAALGWGLMVATGIAASEFGWGNPVGFWPCAAVGLGVTLLLDRWRPRVTRPRPTATA